MTFALTSPVTGGAQTSFTSPTYTLTEDTAPDVNGKQWAVTALGGTQVGATVHSVAAPFTVSFWKPRFFKFLGKPNPTTGLISSVPMNSYKCVVRKGVTPAASQPEAIMVVTLTMDVPAGSDTYDPAEVKAALSLAFGSIAQASAGIGDTTLSGIM